MDLSKPGWGTMQGQPAIPYLPYHWFVLINGNKLGKAAKFVVTDDDAPVEDELIPANLTFGYQIRSC